MLQSMSSMLSMRRISRNWRGMRLLRNLGFIRNNIAGCSLYYWLLLRKEITFDSDAWALWISILFH